MTVIEHRTTTEPCPRCLRIRPRLTPQRATAPIDSAVLWLWLGHRGC